MKLYIIIITASVLGPQIGMAYFTGQKSPVPRAVEFALMQLIQRMAGPKAMGRNYGLVSGVVFEQQK